MSSITDSQNTQATVPNTANVENDSATNTETPNVSESEFTRAAVEGLGNRVRVTDNDEASGLELFCYVRCGPEDSSLLRQCRGVVFHENDIVMRAFPYTVEYAHTDDKQIEENIQSVFRKCSFYDAHEGALIQKPRTASSLPKKT